MPKTVAKAKARRADSAADGGVFCSRYDLCRRWGSTMRTTVSRIKAANIPEYVFTGQSVRYKLEDVVSYENQALARGFLKRSEQLKRLEAEGMAK